MYLIGLTGKKHSGKDTVCNIMQQDILVQCSSKRLAFADALKEEVARACGVTVNEINANKELYRPILQWWGTEFRRGQDPEYWTKQLLKKIHACSYQNIGYVIVTDVRFENEANLIHELGGTMFRVYRPSIKFNDTHASETDLDKVAFKCIPNTGTLDDLGWTTFRALKENGFITPTQPTLK